MRLADEDGFNGIVRKQQNQRAKLRFQNSIAHIIRDHRQLQEHRAKLDQLCSQSCTKNPSPRSSSNGTEASSRASSATTVHKFKRAVSIIRVKDVMNLNFEEVVIPEDKQEGKKVVEAAVNGRGGGNRDQENGMDTGEISPAPKSI